MTDAVIDLFCDSFADVPRRILLDIDDTEDGVHGRQQSAPCNAHDDSQPPCRAEPTAPDQ